MVMRDWYYGFVFALTPMVFGGVMLGMSICIHYIRNHEWELPDWGETTFSVGFWTTVVALLMFQFIIPFIAG
ncbi:hypothetical protein [Alicyclobacillus macrosporangiidus]|uniref:hypothetical protein n=1 Tax=Alicyclobacillus macrosporangiidus TaxID=392015 RepID=UPI000496C1A1|nr:hypothetical protein [Alicyclobacillus macrosporangiidus]